MEKEGARTPLEEEGVWAAVRVEAPGEIAYVLIADTRSPMKGAPPAWRPNAPSAAPL